MEKQVMTVVWGVGRDGQLGLGPNTNSQRHLEPLLTLAHDTIVQLSDEGNVWCFGAGTHGRTGLGHEEDHFLPKLVRWDHERPRIISLSCGFAHTLLLSSEFYGSAVWAFGFGEDGALGLDGARRNHTTPQRVKALDNAAISKIAAGGLHSMALDAGGFVYTWGHGRDGRLGLGHTDNCLTPTRVPLEEVQGHARDISAGYRCSGVVSQRGEVWCCGKWDRGVLGLPPPSDRTNGYFDRMKQLQIAKDHCVIEMALGGTVAAAITQQGKLLVCARAACSGCMLA
ncbi:hypothetical protein CYMTET_54878 [Cymbomonas tetramitiformis]|uniref:Uncharacterized protein n=1 Tax=Cymbomonas tetramitiformis TaxID=36881 RepID=A0AAE0BEB8_9CHLO|nr:hypothetical protein CYMTET_54878 [Cymbomonas tetramitiformis]